MTMRLQIEKRDKRLVRKVEFGRSLTARDGSRLSACETHRMIQISADAEIIIANASDDGFLIRFHGPTEDICEHTDSCVISAPMEI